MKYDIIVADPPWDYNDKGRGSIAKHYAPMKMKDIVGLGPLIRAVSGPQTVLLLWGTWPHLIAPVGMKELFTAWGFTYKTCAFLYLKKVLSDPTKFKKGRGAYTASNSEPCFLGRKNGLMLPVKSRKVRQVIDDRRGPELLETVVLPHSQKPLAFYDRVHELYKGYSVLELFARRQYRKWNCQGDEMDGRDIRDALQSIANTPEKAPRKRTTTKV